MASELSRRLRLRIPTVTHHLQRLRLAGLVQLTVGDIDGQEKDLYALRFDAAESAFEVLRGYLGQA
jgi:DNA-binding transcriptional ArsR family regulator